MDDVWTDIYSPWIMSFSKEKLGYQTQKPRALLRRIIEVSSKPGDVVLDPFCGCGTTVVTAQELRRAWIGIDITHLAIALVRELLLRSFRSTFPEPRMIPVVGEPVDLEGARALAELDRYQFQWWAVGLLGARPLPEEKKKGADKGVDGVRRFVLDSKGKIGRIVIQVKSGGVSARDVRDLKGTVESKAEMGILVTLQPATAPMREEAVKSGYYESDFWRRSFRKIQLIEVRELLEGRLPELPSQAPDEVLAAVRSVEERAEQPGLV